MITWKLLIQQQQKKTIESLLSNMIFQLDLNIFYSHKLMNFYGQLSSKK